MVRRCSGFEIRSNVREKIPLDASDHPTILDHVGNNNWESWWEGRGNGSAFFGRGEIKT